MSPYFAIFGLSSLAALLYRSRIDARYLIYGLVGILIIFAGTRYEVGCDWAGYLHRFNSLYVRETWVSLLSQAEAGFHLLNFAVIRSGFGFETLILVASTGYLVCLVRFAHLSVKPVDVLVLMFPILIVQLGMSGLRQALALGFLLLAFRAFVDQSRLMIALWVLVGSAFHLSALIFLPLALIAGRRSSIPRMIAALVILGPVAAFLMGERLDLYEARYIEQEYGENSSAGAWYRYALVLIPFLVFEWKKRLIERHFPKLFPLLRLFSLITLALPIIGLMSSVAMHRLIFYVMPVSILAMICLAEVAFSRESRKIGRALPFIAYGLYMTVWFAGSRHASLCYVPYDSWLF